MKLAPLLAAALLAAPSLAHAHAFLRSADPAVGGTVHGAPAQVTIQYTEAVEPRFSSIVVRDGAGKQVDRGDVHVAPADAHVLAVSLAPLAPGAYRVEWHVVSVDTHRTEGSYSFSVAP